MGAAVVQAGSNGLLLAVKDNIDVAGMATRAGLGGAGVVAERDAPVVARLRAAGWGIVGKTRMDEAALGASGDNVHTGRTENPAAAGCTPGGSSGGSAAAVAAGLTDAALGTDTMGSVRIPAAFCGILGLKPGRGVMALEGVVPLSPSMDQVGILARDAATLARVLEVFVAPGGGAPPCVGVPDLPELAPGVAAGFEAALGRVRGLGWVVERCGIAGWGATAVRRAGLLLIEAEGAVVHSALVDGDDAALSAGVRAMLRFGRDCGTGRLVRAVQVLRAAEAGWLAALGRYDVIATPTVAAGPHRWGEATPADLAALVAPANWPGLPAISLPLGEGGLHLVGRAGEDWRLVRAAVELGL